MAYVFSTEGIGQTANHWNEEYLPGSNHFGFLMRLNINRRFSKH